MIAGASGDMDVDPSRSCGLRASVSYDGSLSRMNTVLLFPMLIALCGNIVARIHRCVLVCSHGVAQPVSEAHSQHQIVRLEAEDYRYPD
jgi:hypothetical protein